MRLFQELCHKRNCVNPRRRGFRFCMRKDCGNEEKQIIDAHADEIEKILEEEE
jgi:hypothetical protein